MKDIYFEEMKYVFNILANWVSVIECVDTSGLMKYGILEK